MFGLSEDDTMRLLYLVALTSLLILFGFRRPRRLGASLTALAVFGLAILVLVGIYAYRAPLLGLAAPVLDELWPGRSTLTVLDSGEYSVRRQRDGHFRVSARAGDARIEFLVDTGATGTVLSYEDAERAGIDVGALRFDRMVRTANGVAFAARARLPRLEIGPIALTDAPVRVMPDGLLDTSLLGMDVLGRFPGWRVEGDRMIFAAEG